MVAAIGLSVLWLPSAKENAVTTPASYGATYSVEQFTAMKPADAACPSSVGDVPRIAELGQGTLPTPVAEPAGPASDAGCAGCVAPSVALPRDELAISPLQAHTKHAPQTVAAKRIQDIVARDRGTHERPRLSR